MYFGSTKKKIFFWIFLAAILEKTCQIYARARALTNVQRSIYFRALSFQGCHHGTIGTIGTAGRTFFVVTEISANQLRHGGDFLGWGDGVYT